MSEQPTLDAKASLCWTCKHGLCVQETGRQTQVHESFPEEPSQPNEALDPFGEFGDETPPEVPTVAHITVHSVQAICYWRPPTAQNSLPIRVSEVIQCNRYEKT